MSTHFADIVETVKTLSFQEKQELHELIEKYLIEERKLEIYENSLGESGQVKPKRACILKRYGCS